jgi:hypothetical protein
MLERTPMKSMKRLLVLGLLPALGCVATVRAVPPPERHPAYLHALADLRLSRAHLNHPANNQTTAWDEGAAIREIDASIRDLSQAAADDGKNPNVAKPADLPPDWAGRLRRSLELLEQARRDAAHEEDNGYAVPYRDNGIRHIDAAIAYVRQGMQAAARPVVYAPAPPPPAPVVVASAPPPAAPVVVAAAPMPAAQHPAYMHALEDLRHARGHLLRPAMVTALTAWDENVAIREVDAAMNEIVRAAINDGKNVNDHPQVDVRMGWNGRLHRALELLTKARNDCMREEDNTFARGLQQRAITHIDVAIAYVRQGIASNHF